jgi:DNA-binding protein Fis
MDNVEKSIIVNVLSKVQGNQKEAAKVLGIKYTTLNEKLKRYRIRFQKSPIDLLLV